MPREHWNDMPGDIADEDAGENLPGGFGTYNPDLSPDATFDEISEGDVITPGGTIFAAQDQQGESTAGTGYADAQDDGATINPNDLVAGETGHPGAAVGFTGGEYDKKVPPEARTSTRPTGELTTGDLGGAPTERETSQQARNMSVESEGPVGGEGHAGSIQPDEEAA